MTLQKNVPDVPDLGQGLNQAWKKIPQERKEQARQALVSAWSHPEVVKSLKGADEEITSEMKRNASSIVLEFVRELDNPHYKPHLELVNGAIRISYSLRDTPQAQLIGDRIRRTQVYDNITKNLKNISFNDFSTGGIGTQETEQKIKIFLENYEYGSDLKGNWISGARGTGKTFSMGILCKGLKEIKAGFNFANTTELYQSMLSRSRNHPEALDSSLWDLKKAEILILDDMGAEPRTQFMLNQVLYPVLDYRMNVKLPTWFTSNFTIDEYKQHLLSSPINGASKHDVYRLVERIETLTPEIKMFGANRRNKE